MYLDNLLIIIKTEEHLETEKYFNKKPEHKLDLDLEK